MPFTALGGGIMLEIKNISIKTFREREIMSQFSFTLNEGDKIAIIGEEGNGKSTFLKALVDIDLVNDYVVVEGTINKNNAKIGYLSQSLDFKWDDCECFDYILKNEPKDTLSLEQYNEYNKIINLFTKLKLNTALIESNRIMNECSGGEKVKLQIIKLLYQQPDLLLLDEPTNDLDIETLIWLEEFINQSSIPILFVTHDETLLENCANGIIHFEQLKRKTQSKVTFEKIGYRDYVEKRMHLISRVNKIARKERSEYDKQLETYRKIYQKVDHQLNTISRGNPHGGQLLKKKMHSVKSLGRRLDNKELTHKFDPEEAITIFFDSVKNDKNKIICDYHIEQLCIGDKVLSNNINLFVKGNEHVVIIGKNGIGKSTLLKQIMVYLEKRDGLKVGYVPQNYEEILNLNQSAVEFLMGNQEYEMLTKVHTMLGSLKLKIEEMNEPMSQLSLGQRCKVCMISVVINKCNVLILDEPTRNMSSLSNPVLRELFNSFEGCIISVSHDRKFIDEVCDTIYEMTEDGLYKIS